jgi:hypothetical protein
VVYDFEVAGRRQRGTRIEVGLPIWYLRRRTAERIQAKYPVGAVVDAWVDPDDPSLSVLECRAPYFNTLKALLVFLGIVAVGGTVAILATR